MRISPRGLVWLGVGILVQLASMLADWHLVVRFTSIPLGLVIMGLGVAIIAWDAWKGRQRKESPEPPIRNKDDGSAKP